MSGLPEFAVGSEASSSDGASGELSRVVIDPVARTLTHLVVGPRPGRKKGGLVPINLAVSTTDGVALACITAEFEELVEAEETQFIPGESGQLDDGRDQKLSWPYYGLGTGGNGVPGPLVVTNDRVPMGEVEVRRGEQVFATDGAIGRVRGLVVHRGDHCVTHVLLDEGHLWGQKRAIPISDVKEIEDGVRLNLTKDEVRDMPLVEVDEQE